MPTGGRQPAALCRAAAVNYDRQMRGHAAKSLAASLASVVAALWSGGCGDESCAPDDETAECAAERVREIDWSSFGDPPLDGLATETRALSNNALRFLLSTTIAELATGADGTYDLGGTDENHIRPPAETAVALAVALQIGLYDEATVGAPRATAAQVDGRLIRSLAMGHIATRADGWGAAWQSAYWAFDAGFAGFLMWQDLDRATRAAVVRMVRFEADRFDADPPYSNDGTSDTKAEENAWNALILVLALAMMPDDPDAVWWRRRATQWLVSAYSRPSDLENEALVDGMPVNALLDGYNMTELGYVYNHDRIHPDYQAAVELLLWNSLVLSLARQPIPEAASWNASTVYGCLVDCVFASPPYQAPGGTIYVDGQATVYYPEGTDWSPSRVDNFFVLDVLADVLAIDRAASKPATSWTTLRAAHLRAMQGRSDTGRLFIEADGFNFASAESFAALHFTFTHLALWLRAQDAVSPVAGWPEP